MTKPEHTLAAEVPPDDKPQSREEAYKRFVAYFTPKPGDRHVCSPASMKQIGGHRGTNIDLRCRGCRRQYSIKRDSPVAKDWLRIHGELQEGKFSQAVQPAQPVLAEAA